MAQMKKPAPKKPMAPRTPSTGVKKPMPKPLTGPAAVKEYQRQVSPAGVKKAEANAKKAIAKKYPELTKKSNAKKDFEKAYKSGKLTVNKGEIITPGSIVRGVAKVAAKVAGKQAVKSEAKANARALKAANKDVAIKYKKGYNESNYSGRNESKPKQVAKSKVRRIGNPNAPMTQPSSYKEAKSAYNAWAKKNPEVAKANPPSGKFGPNISRSEKVNKKLSKLNKKSK
jgi:predicted DNA-binding WGR domain protein